MAGGHTGTAQGPHARWPAGRAAAPQREGGGAPPPGGGGGAAAGLAAAWAGGALLGAAEGHSEKVLGPGYDGQLATDNGKCDLAYVLFHVDRDARRPHAASHKMIPPCLRSIEAAAPGCPIVLLTDEHTQFSGLPAAAEVARVRGINYSKDGHGTSHTKAMSGALPVSVNHVAVIDTDILLVHPLDEVFRHRFEIGVTYRERPRDMPINSGVVFFHKDAVRQKGAQFMNWLMDLKITGRAKTITNRQARKWYGAQHMLWEAMKGNPTKDTIPPRTYLATKGKAVRAGYKVMMFPCDVYNGKARVRKPGTADECLWAGRTDDKPRLWHFKGGRKKDFYRFADLLFGQAKPFCTWHDPEWEGKV